jgi:hypothetical protein
VVTAPLHLTEKRNKITPNFIGLAQLMVLAHLVKEKPYWAKDIVFIVSDLGQIGIQAWINSYYDIKTECNELLVIFIGCRLKFLIEKNIKIKIKIYISRV